MALARHNGTVQDTQGNIVPSAMIEVRRQGGGDFALVPLFSNRQGTALLGNPFQADSSGQFGFHVVGGSYRVRAYLGPSNNPTFESVQEYVAVGTSAETDIDQLGQYLSAGFIPVATVADLPGDPGDFIGAMVLIDPDPELNGVYLWDGADWARARGFPDSVAVWTQTGGTADALEVDVAAGVDPSMVRLAILTADDTNTGPATVSILGADPVPILSAAGAPLAAAEIVGGKATILGLVEGDWRVLLAYSQFAFRGAWAAPTNYVGDDIVESGGSLWLALRSNAGVAPVEGADWTLFLPGVTVADGSITDAKIAPGSKVDNHNRLEVCPEDFAVAPLVYGRNVTEAQAIANRDAIQLAYDFLAAVGGGVVRYRSGQTYEVHRSGTEDYALLFSSDNIWHIGHGACIRRQYDPADPFSLIRLGDEPVGSTSNGRPGQVNGGGLVGLEIDGGCDIQLITNGKAFDGTTGWTVAGGGTLTTVGGTDSKRAFRVTSLGVATRITQAIETEIGADYYVLVEVMAGGTSANWNVWAATTSGTGAIIVQANQGTQPDGYVKLEFTATTTTTYIGMQANSAVSGQYRDFRDIRVWESRDQDSMPMIYASGLKDYVIDQCHLHDSNHYLIGLQNGGYEGVRITNNVLEDNLMDAIDHKNNGSVSHGNVMSNNIFRRNCLLNEPAFPTAAVDLSRGWTVSNLQILEVGAAAGSGAGLRFKVGELASTPGRGVGGRYGHASNIFVEADLQSHVGFVGIHAQNKDCEIKGFTVLNTGIGIFDTDTNNKFSGGTIANCKAQGILTEDKPASASFAATFGDQGQFSDITVFGCAVGARLTGDEAILRDCRLFDNVVNFENTGDDNAMFGGKLGLVAGVTTKQVTNSGARLKMKDVLNFDTKKHLTTASISVAVLGTSATQTTNHGLGYTPTLGDVIMSTLRDTNAAYIATFDVVGVSSTAISWRCNTAEVEAGATAKAHIHIDTLTLPAIA